MGGGRVCMLARTTRSPRRCSGPPSRAASTCRSAATAPRLDPLGEGYLSTDWIEMNRSLFSALWLEKVAIGITIGLIVMVAALNIVATLILMVMEKHKDIAILVSMGAPEGAIRRIFVLQGTIIGLVGTAAGSLLGWGACRLLARYRGGRIPEAVYQIASGPVP